MLPLSGVSSWHEMGSIRLNAAPHREVYETGSMPPEPHIWRLSHGKATTIVLARAEFAWERAQLCGRW